MSRLFMVFCAGFAWSLLAEGVPAWAQDCADDVSWIGNAKIQTLNGRQCLVSVGSNDAGKAYRRYTASERGTFQFFCSFDVPGPQTNTRTTGARAYFLFPRRQKPAARIDNATQTVEITLTTGDRLSLNPGIKKTATARETQPSWPVSQPNSGVTPRCVEAILPSNGGGCELVVAPTAKVLVLDTGFSMAKEGFRTSSRTSKFIDPSGVSCVVPNADLFSYVEDPTDPSFKFATDGDLARFLATRCPALKLTGILPAPGAAGGGVGGATPVDKAK